MADDARLIAVVEANTKSFENAMKRLEGVTKTSTDRMTASVKKMDSSFASVGKRLDAVGKSLAGFVSVGAIQQVIKETIAWGDALGDLADQTGLTTKQIQVLRYAAKQTGSSAEQMDASLKKFGVTLAQARTKGNDLKKILDANGISLTDMAGKARPTGDILNDVIDLIGRLGDEQKKAALTAAAFGKGNDELITTYRRGLAPIKAWGEELARTGIVTDDTISKLGELDNKFNDVMTHIQAVAANVVANMELDKLLDYISRSVDELADLINILNLLKVGDVAGAVTAATTRGRSRSTPAQKVEQDIAATKAEIDRLFAILEQLQAKGKTGAGGAATVAGPIAEVSAAIEVQSKKLKELMEQRETIRKGGGVTAPTTPTTTAPAVMPDLGGGGGGKGKTFSGEVRQLQASVAATRKLALDRELESILEAASKKAGVIVEVVSGGQAKIGTPGPRTGTTRHDLGRAADLRLRDPATGKILDANNPADLARIQSFLGASASAGATGIGFGAGYMGTRTMHVGMGLAGQRGPNATWGGAPWLAGTVAAGRANPMFVEGREQARLSVEEEEAKKLIDEQEEGNKKSLEHADALRELHDALYNVNQEFKRDLVGGFIRDLERGVKPAEALANALMKIGDMLLDQALKAIFPDIVSPILGAALAGGGVMTGHGLMPLRKYAGGGVAHSPQMAIFGEGSGAEAFVPLPDGRRIPVNIRVPGMGGLGGGRGGQAVSVHNRVTVDPSPLFVVTTHEVARQAGHTAVAEAGDASRRRPGGR